MSIENEILLESDNQNLVKEADAKVRNIIVDLLKTGSVQFELDSLQYKLLRKKENEDFIRSYLRNINIELVVDPDIGLAYIKNLNREDEIADAEDEAQLDPESEAFVEDKFLINKSVLTPFKSILILILRKYYQERFSQGESSIVIDIDYIKNALLPYMNISVSDRKDQQKLNGALRDLCEYHLLKRLPSEDNDRFLILPLIRFVVDLNKLNELLEEFRKVNGTVVGSEDADNE
ncbi:MAG: DUF4194 domain-containing protein [Succinivibrio sp.]|nr:DUF4194 domain-containing protein [Succinivibrio sp.]MCI5639062.1 DUF4194 domain-containing protein [Succinivibrio sp.]MCI6449951.1 DUF4194 domain-containing protein [Succinivibrio sp.]MCI7785342.1 DUF4194 domain-containing protein [Succinivibrio sp.]MDD6068091.1 DUF4194 domain-containing protein [Succinivibrio sp.]